jgi:glycosyltransferase involved in cell wall biosynthesis
VHHTRRTPLYYWIDRLCLPRYELVICVSPDLHDRCLASRVPKSRCVLIENGVDTKEYCRRSEVRQAKQKLGVNPERFLVGAVGRLSAEKGFDLLIRAVDQLLRRGLDLELAIVGEGEEKSRLQDLIAELGRSDRIRLLGYRSDITAVYEAMDVYALSSLREGLPNVLLEAMALEVPVVATRIAGVPRLIQAEENGLLVEPGSIEELTEALARLLGDEGLRHRLCAAGRRTVETGYSFTARMRKIQALYDNLLGRN